MNFQTEILFHSHVNIIDIQTLPKSISPNDTKLKLFFYINVTVAIFCQIYFFISFVVTMLCCDRVQRENNEEKKTKEN